MKVLRCLKCGEYTIEPRIEVRVTTFASMDQSLRLFHSDPDFDMGDIRLSLDNVITTCPDCEGKLELVELERCVHRWESRFGNIRRCVLCGIEQKGRVVFE